MKPNEEQLRVFWDHFDIEIEKFEDGVPLEFIGESVRDGRRYLPHPVGLDSLFEHAVVETVKSLEKEHGWGALREFFKRWMSEMGKQSDHLDRVDFALALFWVCDGVRAEQQPC